MKTGGYLQVTNRKDEVGLAEHANARQGPALYPKEECCEAVGVLMEPTAHTHIQCFAFTQTSDSPTIVQPPHSHLFLYLRNA